VQLAGHPACTKPSEAIAHPGPPLVFRRATTNAVAPTKSTTIATGATQAGRPPEPDPPDEPGPPVLTPATGPAARGPSVLAGSWCAFVFAFVERFALRLGPALGEVVALGVDGALDVVDEDGVRPGAWEEAGLVGARVVGLDVGWVGCGVGEAPGAALPAPPCQDIATYPPAGTFREPAPVEENAHFPDLPSDHHSDQ
jgi:hypothetical protein